MLGRVIVLLIATLHSFVIFSQNNLTLIGKFNSKQHNIVVKIRIDTLQLLDSVNLVFEPIGILGSQQQSINVKPAKNEVVWKINSDGPIYAYIRNFIKKQSGFWASWLLEPGDSIVAEYDGKSFIFSGIGMEKLTLKQEMDSVLMTIEKPKNPNQWVTNSLQDFLDFDRYCMRKLDHLIPLIDSYRGRISDYAWNTIRVNMIARVHEDKNDKFSRLISRADGYGISKQDLVTIFDSCFYIDEWKWVLSNPDYCPGWYAFIRSEVGRNHGFDYSIDSMNRVKRKFLYYQQGKRTYSGLALQKFLLDLIHDQTIYELGFEVGFTLEVQKLLDMYYNDPEVRSEYKQYVKAYELKMRQLVSGKRAPEFSLTDTEGRSFTSNDLKGKIAILDFWFTGCVGCIQMTPALKKIEKHFKGDSNIVFLSISIDEDKAKWINSVKQGKYTTGHGVNLYTSGQGDKHQIITGYSIGGYPTLHLIDPFGKIVQNPLPDPRRNPEDLIKLIEKQTLLMNDGPYLIYNNSTASTYSINVSPVSPKEFNKKTQPKLDVQTDKKDETFPVPLKPVLKDEPCEFKKPGRLLVLSDIEGNFDAFRKLLQNNGVIDSKYNWIFGDGHLVFAGDMFDRGQMVTECLWLIYSLEEKAKKKKGYVHFILGNHEIMNLSGDDRYIHPKYRKNIVLLNKKYAELFDKNSELGKWLRTKNIIEKVGDLLFTHAGFSKEVNQLPLSIRQFNEMARPYYDRDTLARASTNSDLKLLFDAKTSPFWYRLFYRNGEDGNPPRVSVQFIDSTLQRFGASHIITGHTIVADTISVHYGGKVINTDTKHAEGKSEALLINGDKFYRVNDKGEKKLLFVDDKKPVFNVNRSTK